MLSQARTTLNRWTALAAVLAVLFASDARMMHRAFCSLPSSASDQTPDCTPRELCCIGDNETSPSTSEACFAFGSCGCCSHAPPRHSSEPDVRMTSEPVPLKVEIGLASGSFGMLLNLSALSHPALVFTPGTDANASHILLCNHLRF
jgi:hypothetical protein